MNRSAGLLCVSALLSIPILSGLSTAVMARSSAQQFDAQWARDQEVEALRKAGRTTASLNMAAVPAPAVSPEPLSFANQSFAVVADPEAGFGPVVDFRDTDRPVERVGNSPNSAFAAVDQRDIWRENDTYSDRLRLTTRGDIRRADGSPVLPTALDRTGFDVDSYDVSYTRGWQVARAYTPSGLEVALIPHAGIGVGDSGGSAEAGATLRIGAGMDKLAPDGAEQFGKRARWYVYAAGSGRAVGYNFARNRDGDYARSGMSHDTGSFLGDASVGVAYRRGDMQGSFGVVYREIRAEGLYGGEGFDNDVSEGLIAFQLSIKPQR